MIQINPLTHEEREKLKTTAGLESLAAYHCPAYIVRQTELTDECIEKLADAIARRLQNVNARP